ncbi:alpha/beta hydrolase [Dactylosporangium roseum]|uniref:Alpha/beta hydrolase n=1 Tax=Dactylosporangium roseum TaxID=47989 RepID=A0ABY5Z554_9ACTN|nr:alpha/beta hydrolase [Dactylosporangium roseum]UWZ37190.1 alpha/beta hydrolase [Dactylosporangium roseum]
MTATPAPLPGPAPRRWPRRAAYAGIAGAAGLAVLLPTGTAGAGWYLTGQVLNVNGGARYYPVRVRAVTGNRITLTRTPDTARSIPLSFVWADGHARLGPVVALDRASVTREVAEVTRGSLVTGVRGYTSGYVFEGDPMSARGLPFEDVIVQGELGPLPAWLVPPTTGPDDTWIIAVHGRGAPRGEALRALPTLAESGHPTLVVTYRNDPEAPPSSDHRFHLGHTEGHDVLSAIEYARSAGARDVILVGWSMGGAAILSLLRSWDHGGFLRGVVLDCPVVDWTATLQMNARQLNVPPPWTWTALKLIQRRLGVRASDLDYRSVAGKLDVPTLVYVDHDDRTVAPWPTVEFAAASPLVTLVETREAGHCRSWNLDPVAYESALRSFLKSL